MVTYQLLLLFTVLFASVCEAEYLLAEYAPAHDDYKPHDYQFGYAVSDPHTGDHKHHWEIRVGDTVKGEYSLLEPDGTTRVVEYTADKHGFRAVVKKLGEAVHPAVSYKSYDGSYASGIYGQGQGYGGLGGYGYNGEISADGGIKLQGEHLAGITLKEEDLGKIVATTTYDAAANKGPGLEYANNNWDLGDGFENVLYGGKGFRSQIEGVIENIAGEINKELDGAGLGGTIYVADAGAAYGLKGLEGVGEYKGLEGAVEYKGLEAVNGYKGLEAVNGYKGLETVSGYKGLEAVNGYKGLEAVSGYKELEPVSGYKGLEPVSGYKELEPVSGYKGLEAVNGYKGLEGASYGGVNIGKYDEDLMEDRYGERPRDKEGGYLGLSSGVYEVLAYPTAAVPLHEGLSLYSGYGEDRFRRSSKVTKTEKVESKQAYSYVGPQKHGY